MKKTVLFFASLFTFFSIQAQEASKETPKYWTKKGNISVLFSQAAYNNNWLGGGTSNVSGNFGLDYDFNYKKDNTLWDNKFIAAYGLSKIKGNEKSAKTDDRLEFNSLWGKKISDKWYYSAYFNFRTQMDVGYDKNGNPISHFFSPAYFQLGPGLLYKKDKNFSVNFAPVAAKLIIVHPHFTENATSFGVLQGDAVRFELGASISADYKLLIMTNVSMENRLNLYSNYLDNPQNVDVNYQMSLKMKINKYLSANVAMQTIYDDNSIKAVQVSEVFGLGVNVSF